MRDLSFQYEMEAKYLDGFTSESVSNGTFFNCLKPAMSYVQCFSLYVLNICFYTFAWVNYILLFYITSYPTVFFNILYFNMLYIIC